MDSSAGSGRATENLSLDIENPFSAVQLSSLDDQPIATSRRLLLTTTALATNTGIRWKDDRQTLAAWGEGPTVIEPVRGHVLLTGLEDVDGPLTVTGLTVTGRPAAESIEVPLRDGVANIPVGDPACTWYLLERVE